MSRFKKLGQLPRTSLRYGRLGANLLGGGALISAIHRFPSLSGIRDLHLNDYPAFRFWVEDLVRSLNTRLFVQGEPVQHALFASNHISWLDTVILNHAKPVSFLARHDLVEWPLIGTFTRRMHSVYVDRTNKFTAYRSLNNIVDRLNEGRSVVFFPESTTSNGSALLHFHPMFFEAAVRTGVPVQPVAIRYKDNLGNYTADPAFIDDDSFVDTMSRLIAQKKVRAELVFLEPVDAKGMNRKELCWETRKRIGQALLRD